MTRNRDIAQLLYVSTATPDMTADKLARIDFESSVYNPLNAITGLLCYDGQRFMQLLEGAPGAVDQLFAKISADCRHRELDILYREPAKQRAFGDWAMRCVQIASGDVRKGEVERLLAPSLGEPLRSLMKSFEESAPL